jgi:hypothetical protein
MPMRKPEGPRSANHRGAEGNSRKATVRSSAKSGSEKLWHRLRANLRRVRRSAGKVRPGGRAFAEYVRREESLEKPVSSKLSNKPPPQEIYSYSHQGKPFLNSL